MKKDKTRTLLTFHDLTVEVETSPSEELIEHMHSTVLGTPGGFRYRHLDLGDRLVAPGENYFMFLRKKEKMMGSVGFVGRHTHSAGLKHDAWMIRYFSIKAPMREVPKKRKDKKEIRTEKKRASVLGRFILPVFAEPGQLRGGEQQDEAASIVYALIESKNLRSMNFSSEMGLETVRHSANFSFSRLTPKLSNRMEMIGVAEEKEMMSLLEDFYKDYTLFVPGPLFSEGDYFVIREEGRIVAGLKGYPVRWKLVDLGSSFANGLFGLLSRIPWIRRRINPEEVRLLAFDGIYFAPGKEDVLYELMESLLARKKTYMGMLMMDRNTMLYELFQKKGKLGILHKVFGEFNAELRIRFNQIPDEVQEYFREHPTYIPTYDNT